MADTQAAKDKLMEDFSAVINDSQELLKAMGAASGDRAASLRGDLDRKLRQARERLDEMQGAALERGREAARQADEYVHDNPWQSIEIGAGVAAVIGIAIGVLLSERR